MGWLRKRFGESSTHVGLQVVSGSLAAYLTSGSNVAIATALTGFLSMLYPQSEVK
jgi:hypothetical protein